MTGIGFYKMSASGNDFILIDNRDGKVNEHFEDVPDFVSRVCRRCLSVGADGVILIEEAKECDFAWKFYNADGSEAEMCGNGGRCAARFAYENKIAKAKMSFETVAGMIKAKVSGSKVKLQLTTPSNLMIDYPIHLEEREIFLCSINTGVPHAVLLTDDLDHAPVAELGRLIRYHKAFGDKGTNVDFVKVEDKKNIRIRTYERGVEGETLACGTGAVAVGCILKEKHIIESPVNVWTKSGEMLKVYMEDEVHLEGDARIVYIGSLHHEALL